MVSTSQSPYARLYDPRRGLAAYYRYGPRRVNILTCSDNSKIWPIVHHSVLMRMAYGSAQYAPISLPHEFWVHDPSGALVALSNSGKLVFDAAKTLGEIDTPTEPLLAAAMTQLAKADEPAVQLVWDTVFWRRCVYFLTIVLTGWLVAFP